MAEAAFSEADITVLQTMADNLANALTNAKLYDQAQKFASELEDRVIQRTAQLEMANKELEAFSYSVSHDLRAPLRHLNAYSRILLDDFNQALNADGQRYLNVIREAAIEMSKLIDDMLRLSRITRQEIHAHAVDMSGIAEDILIRLRNENPERRVELSLAPQLTVTGDGGLLRVALENLLNNAWKFTSKREVTRLEFGQQELAGEKVFYIRDNGVGFDMKFASKLFTPFQRLHSPADFSGTGIGLAIVNRVIQRHHGRIWVESQPDVGTTFFFTLG
jgi:light-regulated signal transduction histidine kinase (bacteriophytochrome)